MVTEETPLRPTGVYETSKAESDQLVQQAAEHGAFSCTVLRPSIVFGPGMRNRSLHQMTAMIDHGFFFFIGPKGAAANYIFIDNVIEALVRCGRLAAAKGKVYNLSDHLAIEEFVALIADGLGKSRPKVRVPEGSHGSLPGLLANCQASRLPNLASTHSTTRVVYPATRMERELGYAHAVTMKDALSLLVYHRRASA